MSRTTWFAHRRLRSGRPRRLSMRSAAPVIASAAAAAAPATAAPAAAQGGADDGGGRRGGQGISAGGGDESHDTAPAVLEPPSRRPNGVCIPPDICQDNIDDFVACNFVIQHCLSREATDDYLRQKRSTGTCLKPHTRNSMVGSSSDLHTRKVDCCRAGCVAFTARSEDLTVCDVCDGPRFRADGRPHKEATF